MTPSTAAHLVRLLVRVREFVETEHDNRTSAGGRMTDYEGESQEALDDVDLIMTALAPAPAAPWVHTTEQLVSDLRLACARYYFRALTAEGRVKEMQQGIGQAMTALTGDPDNDVVWFDKFTTLWEHLYVLRDPEDVLPVPPHSVADDRVAHAYAQLPRDPATGRPVIA